MKTIHDNDIEGLIVTGGDGSLTGAHVLATKYNIPVVGVPATIDLEVTGLDLTLGADTAVNVAHDALDKIRDTQQALKEYLL